MGLLAGSRCLPWDALAVLCVVDVPVSDLCCVFGRSFEDVVASVVGYMWRAGDDRPRFGLAYDSGYGQVVQARLCCRVLLAFCWRGFCASSRGSCWLRRLRRVFSRVVRGLRIMEILTCWCRISLVMSILCAT